jgi:tRNA pseudouridine55 synthase
MNGVFVVDKPEGMTSHDVVQAVRKKFSTKAGHLGTLDPIATGVLPICIGKATRVSQFLSSSPKIYMGRIRFGFATDTYDREGKPITEDRPVTCSKSEISDAMRSLTGALDQVPPPYSAKKVGGVSSHKLARKGNMVALARSLVEVREFEMTSFEPPCIDFQVVCSPGTYVRSLAHDLGLKLGCGGHLESLRRIQSGEFVLEQAVSLERLSQTDLIPMESLLCSLPRIEVSESEEEKVVHGAQIPGEAPPGLARIFNKQGKFIAVAAIENGWVLPKLVLTSINSD